MAKMPMVKKNGKKVPAFAADGVGKMMKGGMAKKKTGAYMYGGMAKKPAAKKKYLHNGIAILYVVLH